MVAECPSEAAHVARRDKCLLELGRTVVAGQAIGESLTLMRSGLNFLYRNINVAIVKLDLSVAHVQAGDIDEGAATLANVGDFISQNRADRLAKRMRSIRASLEPWQDASVVKKLDDQIYGFGLCS